MAEQRKHEYEPSENDDSISVRVEKRSKNRDEQEDPSTSTGVFARLSYAYEIGDKTTLPTKRTIESWRQNIETIVPVTPIERCASGHKDYILRFPEDEELRRDAAGKIPEQAWFGRFRKHLDQAGDYKRKMLEVHPMGRNNIERVFHQWFREQNAFLDTVENTLSTRKAQGKDVHLGRASSTPMHRSVEMLSKLPFTGIIAAPKLDSMHFNMLVSLPREHRNSRIASSLHYGISFAPDRFLSPSNRVHYHFSRPSEWLSAYLQGLKDASEWFSRLSSLSENNKAHLEDIERAASVWRDRRKEWAQNFMDAVIWRTCRTHQQLASGDWRVEDHWAFVSDEWQELLRQWKAVSVGVKG